MNSLVCIAAALAVLASVEAGEAPIQKRGIVGGYGLYGYGGYASGYGHGHYGVPVASYSSYGYHGLHPAPVAYSKVVVPTVAKVAYPAYSYSAYPFGYSKLGYGYSGYPFAYSKVAYSAYPYYGYSKILSPYHYW